MKFNSMFEKIHRGTRQVYKLRDESLRLQLERLNKELISKFSLSIPNRNAIIRSLIQFLSQGSIYYRQKDLRAANQDFYIIKADIANFFPSINKHRLYKKLAKSSLLRDTSLDIIKSFTFNRRIAGVPLGMPFSSALSEIYLEEFDDSIRRAFSPIFYVRYVDDILIIKNYPANSTVEACREKQLLFSLLEEIGLSANESKTDIIEYRASSNNELEFEYLGYNFSIRARDGNAKMLYVSIAEKKYSKKILNRLTRYFKCYNSSRCANDDFWILYYRIKNLIFGVTSSGEKGDNHKLKFGIGFSYKFINSSDKLRKLLKTFHYFRTKYSGKFTSEQTALLFSLITVESNSGERLVLNQESSDEDVLRLLNKRVNYTKYSISNLETIASRIGCSEIVRGRDSLYCYNLQIQIMKKLRMS